MALDQAFAKKVQDHLHGGTALTQPTGHKMLLYTVIGTATTGGTELTTGGGYTAGTGQTIAFSAATTATPSVSANSGIVAYTNMPATTIVAVEIKDGSSVRMEWGGLTANKTTASGDTLSFAAAAVQSALQ